MKKIIALSILCLCVCLTGCTTVSPEAGEEGVKVHKPWIFGSGGVDMSPVETGLEYTWISTDYVIVNMLPQAYDEDLDDATSNDNTLLDFNTQIQLQVKDNMSPVLIKNYGINWYNSVIKEVYRNTVRGYISKYGPFDLMSNREVLDSINLLVKSDMQNYITLLSSKQGELPIDVVNVVVFDNGTRRARGQHTPDPTDRDTRIFEVMDVVVGDISACTVRNVDADRAVIDLGAIVDLAVFYAQAVRRVLFVFPSTRTAEFNAACADLIEITTLKRKAFASVAAFRAVPSACRRLQFFTQGYRARRRRTSRRGGARTLERTRPFARGDRHAGRAGQKIRAPGGRRALKFRRHGPVYNFRG